jgi:protein SCO1
MTRTLLRTAVCLSAAVIASGCRRAPASSVPGAGTPASAHSQKGDDSIFVLDIALVDQDGVRARLEDLAGHPMVVTMMYASCTSVCPRVTEDMKAIERQLGRRAKNTRFVLFSLDPGRDTPQALRQFAADHRLDLARWRLFAASEDGVRDLAAVLDVKYAPAASGDISHSALIVVVDEHGVVRHRQIGVGQDPKPLLDALAQVAS